MRSDPHRRVLCWGMFTAAILDLSGLAEAVIQIVSTVGGVLAAGAVVALPTVIYARRAKRQAIASGEAMIATHFRGRTPLLAEPVVSLVGATALIPVPRSSEGALAVDEDAIWYWSSVGGTTLTIPVASIVAVELPRPRSLMVRWRREETISSVMFLVDAPPRWKESIEKRRSAVGGRTGSSA